MKLADVKRLAVKRGLNIRFGLPNGLDCLIDCHEVGRVPGLSGPPDFSLEEGLPPRGLLPSRQDRARETERVAR